MKSRVESLLEDDHDSLDQLLTQLEAELDIPSERAFELLDLFWARLAMHIRAEHLHLFPAIAGAAQHLSGQDSQPALAEVQQALLDLRSDHDFFMKELAAMMKTARATKIDEVAIDFKTRLSAIRKRLETHNKVEEEQVYTWPALFLDEATISTLNDEVIKELKNMPPRFVG